MILMVEFEIGSYIQTIYGVDEKTGQIKTQLKTDMNQLTDAICGYYYSYNCNEVQLKGPKDLCLEIETSLKSFASAFYSNKELIKVNII